MNCMIFKKAYKKLSEIYGNDVPPKILSRFYEEKSYIESSFDSEMFAMLSTLCEETRKRGEHIFVRGTYGSSLIAFLLGITRENPLPSHFYCRRCKRVYFFDDFPFNESHGMRCTDKCGNRDMILDGFNIPFEMHIKNLSKPKANVVVSKRFFDEAREIVTNIMLCKYRLLLLKNDTNKIQIAFAPKIKEREELIETEEMYIENPYISIIPSENLDFARNLETETGVEFDNVPCLNKDIAKMLLDGKSEDVPYVSNERFLEAVQREAPKNMYEYSKLFGCLHGTNTYKEFCRLRQEKKLPLRDVPAYRDDLFFDLVQTTISLGIEDNGLALYLTELVVRGKGEENREFIERIALDIELSDVQIDYMLNVKYMFHKAHSMALIKYAMIFCWYKINYPEIYKKLREKME